VRRPLPPELHALGDHLEAAARRALGRRRTRRQLVLNGLTSLAVALPLGVTVVGTVTGPSEPPTVVVAPTKPGFTHAGDDFPPRVLRRATPSDELLAEPSTLRRALR